MGAALIGMGLAYEKKGINAYNFENFVILINIKTQKRNY